MAISPTQKKPLLLFFVSLEPKGYSRWRIKNRYADYFASLHRIIQLGVNESTQLIICENTVGVERKDKFRQLATQFPISRSDNLGLLNKGLGELSMARKAAIDFPELFENADKVIWMSGRHIASTDSIFEESLQYSEDALISNPDFFYLDGTIVRTEKNGFINDMFFSMKSNFFLEYLDYFEKNSEIMKEKRLGSEQILFSFTAQKKLSTKKLSSLGLLRREYTPIFRRFEKSTWHVC
jgi:hypothetical protein